MMKKVFIGLGIMTIALLMMMSWFFKTESGLNASMQLLGKVFPELHITQASGHLGDKFTLSQVTFTPEQDNQVSIEALSFSWKPIYLLRGMFKVEQLSLTEVAINTYDSNTAASSEKITLPQVKIPIQIEVDKVELSQISLTNEKGIPQQLVNKFNAQVSLQHDTLFIEQISLDVPQAVISANLELGLLSPHSASFTYDTLVKQGVPQPISVAGELSGDINQITINQHISSPFKSNQLLVLNDLLDDLNWRLRVAAEHIDTKKITERSDIELANVEIQAEGSLETMFAKLSGTVNSAQINELQVSSEIKTQNREVWQVNTVTQLKNAGSVNSSIELDLQPSAPFINMTTSWNDLAWPFNDEPSIITAGQGALTLKGSQSDYELSMDGQFNWQQEQIDLSLSGQGSSDEFKLNSLSLNLFEGMAQLAGMVSLITTDPTYQLEAMWSDIKLPSTLSKNAISLAKGNLSVSSNGLDGLKANALANLVISDFPLTAAFEAMGDAKRGFDKLTLKLNSKDGVANYSGQMSWEGHGMATGEIQLLNFDTSFLSSELTGSLSGTNALSISHFMDALPRVKITDIDYSGTLRERPVNASGSVFYTDEALELTEVQIESGQSHLKLEGNLLEEQLNLDWNITSPDLSDFYSAAKGTLQANGAISGHVDSLMMITNIDAKHVAFHNVLIDEIETKLQFGQSPSSLLQSYIRASKIKFSNYEFDSVSFSAEGTGVQHKFELDLQSEPLQINTSGQGRYYEESWEGLLNQFTINNPDAGEWQLTQKDNVVISTQYQSIPKHCWASTQGNFCIEGQQIASQALTLAGSFTAVPVRLFDMASDALKQVQGQLNGRFTLTSDESHQITGEGTINLEEAAVQLSQSALTQDKPIQFENTTLKYQFNEQSSYVHFHSQPVIEGASALEANFESTDLKTLIEHPQSAAIKGLLRVSLKDINTLNLNHPAFSELTGSIDASLNISGMLGEPGLSGAIELSDGAVVVNDAGINLKAINAAVNGDLVTGLMFNYTAESGKGTLEGDGRLILNEKSWHLSTELNGNELELMNTPEAYVVASPKLEIEVTPTLTKISGLVVIPAAELEPREFNTTISPSDDVIVVNHQDVPHKGVATELDLIVTLGDKVKLKALGFQGRLTGKLKVEGNTQDILLGTGEIGIQDGSYVAYGQLLHVDDGRIRFSGGSIDDPELDIKAIRKTKAVNAGLHISGRAAAPQANLFSEPVMSQDDVLSYLILGKPIEQASATDAALLASAATGMGLQNGAMIGDQIATTFGLDEFAVRGDSADNAALYVGKYLSPKLYLSYGMGVFESVSTVELRYQLSKIWALKAESGTESGVDLLYTYERD